MQDGQLGALGPGSGALGSDAGLLGVGVPQQSATLARGADAGGEVPFALQAMARCQELDQVLKGKAAAVKCENYRLANQLRGREDELLEELVFAFAHAERLTSSAELQEGARMIVNLGRFILLGKELQQVRKDKAAAVKSENYRRAYQLKKLERELHEEMKTRKGPTGVPLLQDSPVQAHGSRTGGH